VPRRPPAVARVLERVTKTAREHEMFEPGDLVLVSCSGGPDSVCLLHALWYLRRLFKIRLAVFHFDHRLRPDSARDAAYVRRLADRLELPFHLREADDAPLRGESVEAWGRSARRRARAEVAAAAGATRVARGHTLDDQAETVLMALVAGMGVAGLSGIAPKADPEVEPLIDVPRSDVEAFCRSLRLRPRRDPTNLDTSKTRAAIRHRVMPVIESVAGRGTSVAIARAASHLRPLADAAERQATSLMDGRVRFGDDGFTLEVSRPLEAPSVLRVVTLFGFRHMGHRTTESDVAAVVDLARGRPGRRRDLSGGLKAVREKEYVRVSRASPET
jgi:tRNA(Ile)-lysidine synthase